MTQQLKIASDQYEKVVAVMGDGHIQGISKLLAANNIEFETVRLSDLRKKSNNDDNTSASFSLNYKEP